MIISVNFLNGSDYWRNKVLASAEDASRALSDPGFIARVRAWPKFDFCDKTPDQVADHLERMDHVTISVGFYKGWFWSRAIAYEENDQVWFNTRKEAYGAGGAPNLAHETMHKLGYRHNGNSPAGNENTVPWRIGQWVAEWLANPPILAPEKIQVESLTV